MPSTTKKKDVNCGNQIDYGRWEVSDTPESSVIELSVGEADNSMVPVDIKLHIKS